MVAGIMRPQGRSSASWRSYQKGRSRRHGSALHRSTEDKGGMSRKTITPKQTETVKGEKNDQRILKGLLAVRRVHDDLHPGRICDAKDSREVIDDTDTRFVYSNGDANNGGWKAEDQEILTQRSTGAIRQGQPQISFNGTVFELYGIKAPNHSMFTVSIDGGEEVKGDAYAASRTDGNELYYSSEDAGIELEAGDHTAVLTVLEEANEAASNVLGLSVTYAQVYGGEPTEPEEPEFPGYSIVEDMQITRNSDELFKVKYNGNWSGGTYYPGMFHDGYEHYAHSGDSYDAFCRHPGRDLGKPGSGTWHLYRNDRWRGCRRSDGHRRKPCASAADLHFP